jgi:acyl carrier protein
MPEDIDRIVVEILLRRKPIDPSTVRPETTLADLGIDSLEGLEVVFALEDRFNISISDADAVNMKTVGAVVAGVRRLVAEPPASSS